MLHLGVGCWRRVPKSNVMARRSPRRDRVHDVRRLVAEHISEYRVDSIERIGEGLDNIAYQVNGELIVRFGKDSDSGRRAASVRREARLLAAIAEISPVAVPAPKFIVEDEGCLAYFKILGVPMLDAPLPLRSVHGASIAATLGELLTVMHALPIDQLTDLADSDDTSATEWRSEAVATYAVVARHIPDVHRKPVESFLDSAVPDNEDSLVFSHNDLGIEHVLVDLHGWTVTGIIDWSDAAIADPACDFGRIYRDLGPESLNAALHHYRADVNDRTALRERAVFYGKCSFFEDLEFGLETRKKRHIAKCLNALEWLFPA